MARRRHNTGSHRAARMVAKHIGHKPFASKAQARLFFANPRLRRSAKDNAHATGMHSAITARLGYSPAYRALPARKGSTYKRVPLQRATHHGRRVKGRP